MEHFIKEKLTNFKTFCIEKFPESDLLKSQCENFEKIPISLFMAYIKQHIVQHEHNLVEFIKKLAEQYHLDIIKLSEEEKNKFIKYFQLFIETSKEL